MAVINQAKITKKMSRSKKLVGALQTTAERKLQNAKRELLEDFDTHVVTQTLRESEDGVNFGTAGLIPKEEEGASLWGYLGFPEGSSPTTSLRNKIIVETSVRPVGTPQTKGDIEISQKFKVYYPSEQDIEKSTKLTWIGSWVRGIEKGASGLARFIYWEPKSLAGRSGKGIQAKKNNLRNASINRTMDYTSGMLKKFVANIKSKFIV